MRKHNVLIVPAAIFPYVVIALLCAIFFSPHITKAITALDNPFYLVIVFGVLFISIVVSLISVIAFTVLVAAGKADALSAAKAVMITKLVQIPAYIAIFAFCLIGMITVFLWGFVIVLAVLDCINLFMTGLPGAAVALNSARQGKLSTAQAVCLGVLQFVFVADVIAAIVMYTTLKKEEYPCNI